MQVRDWLARLSLVVLTGIGARCAATHAPDAGAEPGETSLPDAAEVNATDAAPGSVDSGVAAADEVATAYCEAACADDPPICEDGYRGNTCFDLCWTLYVQQIHDNEGPCFMGIYHLVECLAENPGACVDPDDPACGEEWRYHYYCQGG